MPLKNRWDLRRQLNRTPSAQVTPSYLATVLKISEPSARNLIPPLLATGIIDENGKLTQLRHDWRHDEQYADACNRMLEHIYPDELRHALPCPDPDRRSVENWFSRTTGTGEAAVNRMTLFYLLLCQGDPSAAETGSASRGEARTRTPRAQGRSARQRGQEQPARPASAALVPPDTGSATPQAQREAGPTVSGRPSLHIDVQIHIPADATAEQIDHIFASMARHLGLRDASGT
jgi:hypothetical protein